MLTWLSDQHLAEMIDQFHWTPGWGNLGTIVVGLLAIGVSGAISKHTLKRSAETLELSERSYERTEERYRSDREQAQNDKILNAVLDAAYDTRKLEQILRQYELFIRVHAEMIRQGSGGPASQQAKDNAIYELEKNLPASLDAARSIEKATILAYHVQPLQVTLGTVAKLVTEAKRARKLDEFPFEAEKLEASADALKDVRTRLLTDVAVLVVAATSVLKPLPPE